MSTAELLLLGQQCGALPILGGSILGFNLAALEAFAAAISAQARASEAEDAARMDWLEVHFTSVHAIFAKDGLVKSFDVDCEEDSISDGDRGRIRAAIDAARANQGDAGSRGETK